MAFDIVTFLASSLPNKTPFTFWNILLAGLLLLLVVAGSFAAWFFINRKRAHGESGHNVSASGQQGTPKDQADRLNLARQLPWLLIAATLLAAAYFGIQIYISHQFKNLSAQTEEQFSAIDPNKADDLKKLEEAIAVRIENRRKSIFWATFVANVSATLGIVAGIGTVWIAIWKYSRAYERQLQDREREHKDRIAGELSTLWQYAVSEDSIKRAGSVAGLQDFLTAGKDEFRPRAVAALALIGRMQSVDDEALKELNAIVREVYRRLVAEDKKEEGVEKARRILQDTESAVRKMRGTREILQTTLTSVIEYAMTHVDNGTLVSVSWQGLKLCRPDFRGANLEGIDLRDAILEEPNFQGANLREARFNAASLKGAIFDDAVMEKANLEHADVAGASFKNTDLRRAILNDVRLLDADLAGCSLRDVIVNWDVVDIGLTKNWRKAKFYSDDDSEADKARGKALHEALLAKYGERREGEKRVLMLMWEMEPIVSGGGWTAAYHLVKNVCRKGANLTIMVPWVEKNISKEAFGNEVELIPVGVETETTLLSQYESETEEQKNLASSAQKAYSEMPTHDQLLTYAYTYLRSHADIVNQFAGRAVRCLRSRGHKDIGVIHAHDWLTFTAAMRISREAKVPWIAHFHSIEADRRKKAARWISMVEQRACNEADVLVVPSKLTRNRLVERYNAPAEKIVVIPNCLSKKDVAEEHLADIDQANVVFAGRTSWQKGPDHFIHIARMMQKLRPKTKFTIFGMDNGDGPSYVYGNRMSYMTIQGLIEVTRSHSYVGYLEPMDESEFAEFVTHVTSLAPAVIRPDRTDFLKAEQDKKIPGKLRKVLKCGCTLLRRDEYVYLAIPDDDYSWGRIDGYRIVVHGVDIGTKALVEAIETRRFVPWSKRFEVFRDASAIVVPSRHEPFGMIVLEAMQAGVPVFVSSHAGVNEVVGSVTQIDETNHLQTARKIVGLLRDCEAWRARVEAQFAEIQRYAERNVEDALIELWNKSIHRS